MTYESVKKRLSNDLEHATTQEEEGVKGLFDLKNKKKKEKETM